MAMVTNHARRRVQMAVAALCVTAGSLTAGPLTAQASLDGDVTPRGHTVLALDVLTYPSREPGGWLWLNPRVHRGLTDRLEAGAAVSYYSNPNGGTTALQPSAKWRLLRDTVHRVTVTMGAQALVGLTPHADDYGMAFVDADLSLHRSPLAAGGASLGAYRLLHRERASRDTRLGAIVTAWEAVGAFRASVSWLSGTNFYGYKSASLTYTLAHGEWIGVGYSRGNAAWHNAGPSVSMGRAF